MSNAKRLSQIDTSQWVIFILCVLIKFLWFDVPWVVVTMPLWTGPVLFLLVLNLHGIVTLIAENITQPAAQEVRALNRAVKQWRQAQAARRIKAAKGQMSTAEEGLHECSSGEPAVRDAITAALRDNTPPVHINNQPIKP